MYIYLYLYLTLSIYLSIYQSIYVYMYIYMKTYKCVYVYNVPLSEVPRQDREVHADARRDRGYRGRGGLHLKYVYIYVYIYIYIYLSIYLSMYLSIYLYIYVYIYINMKIYKCVYVYNVLLSEVSRQNREVHADARRDRGHGGRGGPTLT